MISRYRRIIEDLGKAPKGLSLNEIYERVGKGADSQAVEMMLSELIIDGQVVNQLGLYRIASGNNDAAGILSRSSQHIRDRAASRDQDDGERTMKQTVNAFNAIYGTKVTEEQGWQFMVLLKMVRASNGTVNIDDYEDGAAYFALAGETAVKERK